MVPSFIILTATSMVPFHLPLLTTPNCPVAESLPKEVKEGAMQVEEIEDVDLELVWDPPWTKDMMSDAAKLELNL